MKESRFRSLWRQWRDLTWRGPSGPWLAAAALVLVLGLATLLAAGLAGFNQGWQDRVAGRAAEVAAHMEKGVAHLEAGRNGLAAAEFERVLQLDPENIEALRYLRSLQEAPTVTAVPTVLPPLALPAETAEAVPDAATVLFEQAQLAIQQGQWVTATALLDELSVFDPHFRPVEVDDMRFEVAYGYGIELAAQEHFEEALRAFDQALALRPEDASAQAQRNLAALLADAVGAWGVDWPLVVERLQAAYELSPDYQHVDERLAAAQAAWGDALADEGQWCQAAEHYAAALTWYPSAELRGKRWDADDLCANPPASPSPETTPVAQPETTPSAPEEGSAGAPVSGASQLAFASFAPDLNRWMVYRLPLEGGGTVVPFAEDGSQPDVFLDDGRWAIRSERGDQTGLAVLSADGAERRRLTTFFEDSHPSWSSDGRQIAFDSNREGDRRWRIYRTWAEGGEEVNLGFGRWPAWSPLDDSIAFQGCDERGNRCGLWLMGADGANRRQLTEVPGDAMPAWSPDGTRLAFASAERDGVWNVYLLEVTSGEVRVLASGPAIDAHPIWSPTGGQVAFLSNREGAWAIYIYDLETDRVGQAAVVPGELPDWYEVQIGWGP